MKKILIVTLQSSNIGNRLQNFALQYVLENYECHVTNLTYWASEWDTSIKRIKFLVKVILGFIGIKKYNPQVNRAKREMAFHHFNTHNISNLVRIQFDKVDRKNWEKYDFAITGSDQVWHNWSGKIEELKYFYLQFLPQEKRISYAASFGFENFPINDKATHELCLQGMRNISVREKRGFELVKQVSDKDVSVTLDPTLLLTSTLWKKKMNRPKYQVHDKYILIYFLGKIPSICDSYIQQISDNGNIQIINIFSEDVLEYYKTTPDEFLWLVNNAYYVVTDSFHACVFSILFHRNLMVFNREENGFTNMFTRIETLFDLCGLRNAIKDGYACIESQKQNWESIDRKIDHYRNESLLWLKKCIDTY